jgi:hypothetical protein
MPPGFVVDLREGFEDARPPCEEKRPAAWMATLIFVAYLAHRTLLVSDLVMSQWLHLWHLIASFTVLVQDLFPLVHIYMISNKYG